jgi:hypothetical protein
MLLSSPAVQAHAASEAARVLDVMGAMRELHERTLKILAKAEESNDAHVALRAVREARGNLELLGRLDGSLERPLAPQSGPVNVTIQYVDRQLVVPGAPRQLEGD